MIHAELHVAIVDDMPEDRAMIRGALLTGSERRYHFYEASTGEEAVSLIRALQPDRPDVVLLDLDLPGMSGLDVLRSLAEAGRGPVCPVLLLTAKDFETEARAAIVAGAQDFLGKSVVTPRNLTRAMLNAIERFRLTQALRDSEERYAAAVAGANDGIWDWNILTHSDYLSPRWKALLGFEDHELPNHADSFFFRLHPDDAERVEAAVNAHLEKRVPYDLDIRLRHKNGEYRWFHTRGQALWDAHGKPVRMAGAITDITDRKRDEEQIRRLLTEARSREKELREKQEHLIQASKLASLGTLATGVAHELNNPLNNIALFIGNVLDRMESETPPPAEIRALNAALDQVKRAATIVNQLRAFGRRADSAREPLRLHDTLALTLSFLKESLRLLDIDVQPEWCTETPIVNANGTQLEQVFLNLLMNARDAVEHAPVKRIRVSTRVEGHSVQIRVEDTGIGMTPEVQARIFDPFFTTKEVGKGTGLGLSIAYGIVKDHQGSISVESRPNEGAVFVVSLPLYSPALTDHSVQVTIPPSNKSAGRT